MDRRALPYGIRCRATSKLPLAFTEWYQVNLVVLHAYLNIDSCHYTPFDTLCPWCNICHNRLDPVYNYSSIDSCSIYA